MEVLLVTKDTKELISYYRGDENFKKKNICFRILYTTVRNSIPLQSVKTMARISMYNSQQTISQRTLILTIYNAALQDI